jgi:NAD(P)-dependent dehydrogenase (short-subunit alcohol dehydrogenase family)
VLAAEMKLKSKSVLQGAATANRLLTLGWRAVIADRDTKALERIRTTAGKNDDVYCLELDVTDELAVDRAFSEIAAVFGPICGTANSARISRVIPFSSTSTELFHEIINVNLIGTYVVDRLQRAI